MNEKKLGIRAALTGVIGYFVGSALYSLLGGGDNTFKSVLLGVLGVVVAAGIGVLNYLYVRKKYPKAVKAMAAEEKDERGQLIRGKNSSYTLILIAFLTSGLFIFSVLKGYEIISYIIAGSYVITVLFNIAIHSYLNKNN